MTMDYNTLRMTQLVELLNSASTAYYVHNKPTLSDDVYDSLTRELQMLEQKTGKRLSNSPTNRVCSDLDNSFQKVKHIAPVLSLGNIFREESLIDWDGKNRARLNDSMTTALNNDGYCV